MAEFKTSVADLFKDADVKTTHLTGAAVAQGQNNGKYYVMLVSHPIGMEKPIALAYRPEEAEALANQLMLAASQAAISEVGAAPDELA